VVVGDNQALDNACRRRLELHELYQSFYPNQLLGVRALGRKLMGSFYSCIMAVLNVIIFLFFPSCSICLLLSFSLERDACNARRACNALSRSRVISDNSVASEAAATRTRKVPEMFSEPA